MIDINIEDYKTSEKKIIINQKSINQKNYSYNIIKCYQNLPDIESFECKGINTIKIHKTIFYNLPNLIQIDLRENKLSKISKNFKIFKNLEVLKLDNNQILYIPSFISEFLKLKVFTISNNKLSSIPSSIQYITNLQVLKFSNNKILKLPIEFGLLKSLEILYIDCNYFTEIPTTLCYLRHLNELSFEWLEFLNPPLSKILKDTIGKQWINAIRDSLQEMIKSQILYCDFYTFIDKLSTNKKKEENNNNNNKNNNNNNLNTINNKENNQILNDSNPNIKNQLNKYLKIFLAVENNYYGVIKSLLSSKDYISYIQVKNEENKNPFYISINYGNEDIINLFLEKISTSKLPISHIYLHKAIRVRNPDLVKKLINLGININQNDDQGNGVFHILFSTFTKQLSKCALIGNYLIKKNNIQINIFNNDNWAPIHIAARRGSKECLLWIISTNRKLRKEGREEFNLNLKGHNNWTPLHLTINSFRIEETLILLDNNCDVFARNSDSKTPKKVSIGNFVFTKLLTNYENFLLEKEFKNLDDDKMYIKCYTTVDDDEFIGDNNDNEVNKVPFIKSKTEKLLKLNSQLNENSNFNNKNNSINNSNIINDNNFEKNNFRNTFESNNNNNLLKNSLIRNKSLNIPLINSSNNNNNISKTPNNNKIINNSKNFNNLSSYKRLNQNNNNEYNEISNKDYENKENENKTKNIMYQKEILLNSDSSPFEKYDAFMKIKMSNDEDLKNFLQDIIDNLDYKNDINLNILNDLCNFAISNYMVNLIPSLKQISGIISIKKNKYNIKREIDNTIAILENIALNNNLEICENKKENKNIINKEQNKKLENNIKEIKSVKKDEINLNMFYTDEDEEDENFDEL